jgi:hypothetical protein
MRTKHIKMFNGVTAFCHLIYLFKTHNTLLTIDAASKELLNQFNNLIIQFKTQKIININALFVYTGTPKYNMHGYEGGSNMFCTCSLYEGQPVNVISHGVMESTYQTLPYLSNKIFTYLMK